MRFLDNKLKLLTVAKLTKKVKHQLLFKNLDLVIHKNEWVGIEGANGTGKSTLVKIIMGLENYSSGEIYFEGRSMDHFSKDEWVQKIQLVTQYTRRALDPTKTIEQILLEPLKQFKLVARSGYMAELKLILKACHLSEEVLTKKPNQLSGGQYQRVCLGLALLVKPKLLICDEATASLDKINELKIIQYLKQQPNLAVLMISHNQKMLAEVCNRRICLADFKNK